MFLTYKLQISFKFDFLSPANEQTISSSTCSLQCSDSCRLLPKSETCCARHTGTSSSQRDVYVLVGISKFSFKWRTDTEMKQFIQGSAGSLKQEQEWTQIFMFSHRIVHISQCGKDELHWIENVHLDWAHTERQCCGMDINAHLCSRDQGLDKHWLQPHCCSPGDPC